VDKFNKYIDRQIRFNQNKNILIDDPELFCFSDETIRAIGRMGELEAASKRLLIDYAMNRAIEEFCRVNQYYSFNADAKNELRKIYESLFESITHAVLSPADLSKAHYERLKKWLAETNPFSEKIYLKADRKIAPVACSEYSSHLQIGLLHLKPETMLQPVLDIGCGKQGSLVHALADRGIEAFGIDRCEFNDARLITADWLEYPYEKGKWGTIISNLGFSNHFKHHNLREDGNYLGYARTYMSILHSLKKGGRFHYAPDLPFIEQYLDARLFQIEKHDIEDSEIRTTIITRKQ
jgi:hypothetical protein